MERILLPEFIEIFVPTRDRKGRALGGVKQREWKERLSRYLLETLNVTGFRRTPFAMLQTPRSEGTGTGRASRQGGPARGEKFLLVAQPIRRLSVLFFGERRASFTGSTLTSCFMLTLVIPYPPSRRSRRK